jgi:hypothetical protein
MQRLNGAEGVRGDAVLEGVKVHLAKEPPPLRIDFVPGEPVDVIVQFPVPTIFRDFSDGVDLIEDIFPVRLEIGGPGEQASHANDGDVGGLARLLSTHRRRLQGL